MITAHDIILKMGKALGARENGRYPDLEEDAMRFYVLIDLQCDGDPQKIEELTKLIDQRIDQILGPAV